jgi:hypothetical protein
VAEADETLTFTLVPLVGGATLGAHPIATLTIIDDDGSLDVDASISATKYDALTDGLLVIRYLSGMTGTELTNGALGATATRKDPAVIKSYLDGMHPRLNVDGSGTFGAKTDGLLIMRYLLGLRGDSLIANAVDPLATRKTADLIEAYLATLLP